MDSDAVRRALAAALEQVVPEVDFEHLQVDQPLRDQLDMDSYDFLQLVIALHERLGVDIPESDYQRLATLSGAVEYLSSAAASKR